MVVWKSKIKMDMQDNKRVLSHKIFNAL